MSSFLKNFFFPFLNSKLFLLWSLPREEFSDLLKSLFCFDEKFGKSININNVRFLKGLQYFLDGYNQNQNEIIKFIEYCKSCENKEGYLTQAFYKSMLVKKAQFVSGPFTDMFFDILEKQKNKLKILVGNVVTTISDKTNYLYRPI